MLCWPFFEIRCTCERDLSSPIRLPDADTSLPSYGGIFERGSREYTLDDFYSLQLDKLDRYTCLKESDVVISADGDDVSSDDDDDEDDEDDEDDQDEEAMNTDIEAEEDTTEKRKKSKGKDKVEVVDDDEPKGDNVDAEPEDQVSILCHSPISARLRTLTQTGLDSSKSDCFHGCCKGHGTFCRRCHQHPSSWRDISYVLRSISYVPQNISTSSIIICCIIS